ncbi:MAG: CPP1-like family protein [Microcoleaceae cyanobacterium]
MSEQSPYEQLGVTIDASFDEIQEARDHLTDQHSGERQVVESIEAAYDAILMDRLRMRQEGKIKVPERIRFPERQAPPPASTSQSVSAKSPQWLQQLLDTPTRNELVLPSAIYAGLGVLSLYPGFEIALLQLPLALGVGCSLYFLNRKERKFGRSVLLTIAGLVIGLILGGILSPVIGTTIAAERFITLVTLIVLWLVSGFLR